MRRYSPHPFTLSLSLCPPPPPPLPLLLSSPSQAPPAIDIQWDMTAIITFERWQKRLWDLMQIHKSICKEEGVKPVAEVDTRKLRLMMHRTIKQVSLSLSQHS